MSRLNDRLNKLEGSSKDSESGPRCIIVQGMRTISEKEEIVKLSGHGMSFDRLPAEDEDTFIERAKTSVREANPLPGLFCFLVAGRAVKRYDNQVIQPHAGNYARKERAMADMLNNPATAEILDVYKAARGC